MATPDRKRNNARKAAARAYQSEHPGVRYKSAHNQVSPDSCDSETPGRPSTALSTLLEVSSVDNLMARYQAQVTEGRRLGDRWQGYDGVVPLGYTDDGELVSINIGPDWTYGGDGLHGAIGGSDYAYDMAALIATALRARNAPQTFHVVYADPGNHSRDRVPIGLGDMEFRSIDARDRFAVWLEGELHHREAAAVNGGARDIADLRELAKANLDAEVFPRVLVVAVDSPDDDDYSRTSQRWNDVLRRLVQTGRALDMFLLLVCPYGRQLEHRKLWTNISYRVAVKGMGLDSFSGFDDLLADQDHHLHSSQTPDDTAVLGIGSGSRPSTKFTRLPLETKLFETVSEARWQTNLRELNDN